MRPVPRVLAVLLAGVVALTGLVAQETAEVFQGPAAEQFLSKARVRRVRAIGTGVTLPERATLEMNGVTRDAAFKTIDERKVGVTQFASGPPEVNFQDSWQTEIPAYVVDRIIGLGMVPATVERTINGKTGSLQWWVESMMSEMERRKQALAPPDEEAWNRLVLKMRLFDQLIANVDRHLNNILVTKEFELRLIDHSRSFRATKELREPGQLTRFSQSLLTGIEKLEFQDLKKKAGRYLLDDQLRAVMTRRDLILALVKERVAQHGEAAIIYP
jgi:hypothetical protein